MKHIRTNSDNTIHLISDKALVNTKPYSEELPSDFYETFSKGKYLFVDGELTVNTAWNEEQGEIIALPLDIPYRTTLIQAGISSIKELTEMEDLTQISGIGEAKASEINNYLTNQ